MLLFATTISYSQADGSYCPGPGLPGDEYGSADVITYTPTVIGSGTCAIQKIWADIDIDNNYFKLAYKIGNAGTALFRIYIDSDNNPLTGLITETGFGGSPFSISGAEYILQINSQTGTTKLYKANVIAPATTTTTYSQVPLGNIIGANGDSNGCNGGDKRFLEFYIPFDDIDYKPCETENSGQINIA